MVYCCVPHCKSRAGKRRGFRSTSSCGQELCSKWQRNISRQNLVINDKSAIDCRIVCSRHFRQIDYAPDLQDKKLLPGAVPTVFEDYPAYVAPSAKKPRKEPVVRQSLPPRNQLSGRQSQRNYLRIWMLRRVSTSRLQMFPPPRPLTMMHSEQVGNLLWLEDCVLKSPYHRSQSQKSFLLCKTKQRFFVQDCFVTPKMIFLVLELGTPIFMCSNGAIVLCTVYFNVLQTF
ncbi:hypothetical protein HPB48_022232 [Haemaphysalis longicornis]|uniref:THAP-type domain-containing protein n=1 Tax=Haemaphysalis longicornis TaxID=44386 RepID=A0A9J6FUH8_HAELO|nr:hypothetical protein HPB48_022232 [Haemaphysalis longicornis]